MSSKKVVKMGDPVLRKVALPVSMDQINSLQFQQLVNDLIETMKSYSGLGIAAPQIGISKQVCIVQVPQYNERYGKLQPFPRTILVNPKIQTLTQQCEGFWQGCLSVPGIKGYVMRPRKIKVNYLDQKGNEFEHIIEGFGAVVFQHEVDHLRGTLFIDKIHQKKIAFIQQFIHFDLAKQQQILDD